MKNEIYNKIAKKFICDDVSEELIGFKGVLRNFEIDFYARKGNNYKVQIDGFGYKLKKGWTELEPTDQQLEDMQKRINSEVENFQSLN